MWRRRSGRRRRGAGHARQLTTARRACAGQPAPSRQGGHGSTSGAKSWLSGETSTRPSDAAAASGRPSGRRRRRRSSGSGRRTPPGRTACSASGAGSLRQPRAAEAPAGLAGRRRRPGPAPAAVAALVRAGVGLDRPAATAAAAARQRRQGRRRRRWWRRPARRPGRARRRARRWRRRCAGRRPPAAARRRTGRPRSSAAAASGRAWRRRRGPDTTTSPPCDAGGGPTGRLAVARRSAHASDETGTSATPAPTSAITRRSFRNSTSPPSTYGADRRVRDRHNTCAKLRRTPGFREPRSAQGRGDPQSQARSILMADLDAPRPRRA